MEIISGEDSEEFVIIIENKQEEEFEVISKIDVYMALAAWIESEYYRQSKDANYIKNKSIILWNYVNYAYNAIGWIFWLSGIYNNPSSIGASTLILFQILSRLFAKNNHIK